MIREKRVDGEYFFANIIRYYGEKENTHDYDIGDTYAETAWLGRVEKFVGKRIHDTNPESPTFGKRIYSPAVTENITEENEKGYPITREVLIEGKTIYEYTIPVTKENIVKMKTLAGAIGLNQETLFMFVYGMNPPLKVDPDTFWDTSVAYYLQSINPLKKKENGKKI